jgi:hypothetical protein
MDNSIDFQSTELEGNEEIVHFSIPETKVAQLICRYPRCNSKLATTASRSSHEKSQHSPKKYSCEKCNFVQTKRKKVLNITNWGCIMDWKPTNYHGYLLFISFAFFLLNNKYFLFTEMLKCWNLATNRISIWLIRWFKMKPCQLTTLMTTHVHRTSPLTKSKIFIKFIIYSKIMNFCQTDQIFGMSGNPMFILNWALEYYDEMSHLIVGLH